MFGKLFTGNNFNKPAKISFMEGDDPRFVPYGKIEHDVEKIYGFAFKMFGKEFLVGCIRTNRVSGR